ncbi:MAG: hypothetical protein J6C78_10365 [Muribaculaceae bacterium]|nr:hypothetical protein [Muribaculaceae bacterium]
MMASEAMWKYDDLYKYLNNDPRFIPFIVPSPFPNQSSNLMYEYDKIIKFCNEKNYNYILSLNNNGLPQISAKEINADIVIYTQPYNRGQKEWRINKFWTNSLFIYTPYGTNIEKENRFYNSLLQNISYIQFYPNIYISRLVNKHIFFKSKHIYTSGDDSFHKYQPHEINTDEWKQHKLSLKRIIWAPHHSIMKNDSLQYSTFLEYANFMLEIAKKFIGKVQFIIKPHPLLLSKLHIIWGYEKTTKYFKQWEFGENTQIVWGKYDIIFRNSDGIIHDSSGFTSDYLFTGNPALFIDNGMVESHLNEYGRKCFNLHYKAHNKSDITNFITEVIINRIDPLKIKRDEFMAQLNNETKYNSIGEFMYETIKHTLS